MINYEEYLDDEKPSVFENAHQFGTVEIGGRTYKTVTTGNQEWLAENLCLETEKSYQNPEHPEFGRYYDWYAIKEIQTKLPPGWRIPSDADFNQLYKNIGGEDTAGQNLKSTTGWDGNGNGTDDYGFSVLPAGSRGIDGNYYGAGYYAFFWSSSEGNSYYAYVWYFYYDYDSVGRSDGIKDLGFSVRCVRDSRETDEPNDEGNQHTRPRIRLIK